MSSSRRVCVGWAALLLSCASEHGLPDDAEGGDASPSVQLDAGVDSATTELPDAGRCELPGDNCAAYAQPLDLMATSPSGAVHLRSAAVGYWDGFTNGLEVYVQGEGPDGAFTLVAHVYNPSRDFVVPPGRYTS